MYCRKIGELLILPRRGVKTRFLMEAEYLLMFPSITDRKRKKRTFQVRR